MIVNNAYIFIYRTRKKVVNNAYIFVYRTIRKRYDTKYCVYFSLQDVSKKIRELLGLKDIIKDIVKAMSDPMIAYLEMKRRTGRITQNTDYVTFINKYKRWYK